MKSRKFFTLPNVALLIVAILAAAEMGCEDSVDGEGQLGPRYSYARPFSFGH